MMPCRQNCRENLVLRVAALRVADEQSRLLRLVFRGQRRVGRRCATAIGDRERLQDVAEGIDVECKRVTDARIGRIALVLVGEDLAGMSEEDRMAIAQPWLQSLEREVLLDDLIGYGRALLLLE